MNKQRKHEMGDSCYIITEKGRNGMGKFCWYNIKLRKHGDESFRAKILNNQQFVNSPTTAHGEWEKEIAKGGVQEIYQFASHIYLFVGDMY